MTTEKFDRYTIEPSRAPLEGYTVYGWGTYGRGSVLEGQAKKVFLKHCDTTEQAQADYPKAEVCGGRVSAHNYVGHLPGENDPVPGGMYQDDIGGGKHDY